MIMNFVVTYVRVLIILACILCCYWHISFYMLVMQSWILLLKRSVAKLPLVGLIRLVCYISKPNYWEYLRNSSLMKFYHAYWLFSAECQILWRIYFACEILCLPFYLFGLFALRRIFIFLPCILNSIYTYR